MLTLLYRNGNKFSGEWDGNKGKGEVNLKDGRKYLGQWSGNFIDGFNINGFGTLYSKEGEVIREGKWENGKCVDME